MEADVWSVILIVVSLLVSGCGVSVLPTHKEAIERLEYHYIVHYANVHGQKKCLPPQRLGEQWFTLCGISRGGPNLLNAGLWEIQAENNGGWAVYAYDEKAAKTQEIFIDDPQIRPRAQPPDFVNVSEARRLFLSF